MSDLSHVTHGQTMESILRLIGVIITKLGNRGMFHRFNHKHENSQHNLNKTNLRWLLFFFRKSKLEVDRYEKL